MCDCAGCDKNMPGTMIAIGRLNRPAIMVYGGTIRPGKSKLTNEPLDVVSAFQSYGEQFSVCCFAPSSYCLFPKLIAVVAASKN